MPQAQSMREPRRVPLAAPISTRNETILKDARIINAIVERTQEGNEYHIEKRPGFLQSAQVAPGNTGFGCYAMIPYFRSVAVPNTSLTTYSVFGTPHSIPPPAPQTNMYANGTLLANCNGISQQCYFVEMPYLSTTGFHQLIFGDGNATYATDGMFTMQQLGPGVPGITNFPTTPLVPGFCYLDGLLYVMDVYANIWGSAAFFNPFMWSALNKVTAQIEPDLGVALAKQLNYLIAIKQWTTEVWYDAAATATPATGSVLGPVQTAFIPWGCLNGYTVQEIDNLLFWVTYNKTVSPRIVMLENLAPNFVSTPPVERLMDQWNQNDTFRSWVFKHGGHRFYGVTNVTRNITLVYDIDQRFWYIWTDSNGNFFPITSFTYNNLAQHIGQQYGDNVPSAQSGNLYLVEGDYLYPNDNGVIAPVDIYTPNFDGGTRYRKTLKKMFFGADKYASSILQVRYTEDDYQTYSNFRNVDLSLKAPYLQDCGTFRRRAWNLRHESNTPFRIRTMDLAMDLGSF